MLKIRLQKFGCKHQPRYKIVLSQALTKRNGKFIQCLGFYNPFTKVIKINKNLVFKYLNTGAYPTNTVRHLIYNIL